MIAERFYRRFAGLARGHGRHHPSDVVTKIAAGGEKKEGRSETVHAPVTVELWAAHLAGTYSLGLCPIRDDATCCWGAIDVDVYANMDHSAIARRLVERGLPMVVCKTKSGGAHLYVFFKQSVPAELVRGKLMDWAASLGYSTAEVFPKQTRLAGPNDYGSWINLPYFGGTRVAVLANGSELSAEEFINLADSAAITLNEFSETEPRTPPQFAEDWRGAPPCLVSLATAGISYNRNIVLSHAITYLKKVHGDEEWKDRADHYNHTYFDPPLPSAEVQKVIKSNSKKDYGYRCGEDPIRHQCNKQLCLQREHGIGSKLDDPGVAFGPLVKIETDPPTWLWDVNGARIELTTAELKDQNRFHSRCMEVLNTWPQLVKPKQWADLVRDRLASAQVQSLPVEARPEGVFFGYLEQYCVGNQRAKSRDELLMDKPWTPSDEDAVRYEDVTRGRTYFRLPHFLTWLEQQRFRTTMKQAILWLRARGGEPRFFNIKGRGVNTWHVPAFTIATAPLDVPRLAEHLATRTNGGDTSADEAM